jgi:hypothetical protein
VHFTATINKYQLMRDFFLTLVKRHSFEKIEIVQGIFLTLFMYLCVWQKSIWPWYMLWLIPFGLLVFKTTKNKLIERAIIGLSISPLIYYIIWLPGWLMYRHDATPNFWFFCVIVLSVVIYPLALIFRWRIKNYH